MNYMEPDTRQFMVMKNGESFGPYPKDILLENVKKGNLSFNDLIWEPQMRNWEMLGSHITQDELIRANLPVPAAPAWTPQPQNVYHAPPIQPQHKAAAGLAQLMGLDPRIALIAIVLDVMLFAGEIATLGVLITFSVIAGVVFGFITFLGQKHWYGDEQESAVIKGMIMGLLTAIPSPLPAFLYVPAGFIGLVKLVRKK